MEDKTDPVCGIVQLGRLGHIDHSRLDKWQSHLSIDNSAQTYLELQ